MTKRPLISFCIPTYNRADILAEALKSYVDNPAFDDMVEIVISDNASTDNTQEVGEYYASKYGNIKYFRNEENIRDANFPLSLDRGSGHYLKLMNDTVFLTENGLQYMKEAVARHLEDQTPIFFTTRHVFNHKKADCVECEKFEDFIIYISRLVTAISLFGAWRPDWESIKDKRKYATMQLSQDDWTYQILENKKRAYIYTANCYNRLKSIGARSGYNWYEVQIKNYYAILKPYIDKGLVSKKHLSKEKRTTLISIAPNLAKKYWLPMFPNWQFDLSGATKVLWNHFKHEPWFYLQMLTLPIWANWYLLKYYGRIALIKCGLYNERPRP